ncbi:MAG: phosphatidate cytidylyltransferase [Microbacteriaceae bacterium]|nr:phosphatidate cytidylyltransferase [Microbacteriaceae bacterium]
MSDAPEGTPPATNARRRQLKRADIEARAHLLEADFKAQVAVRRAQIDATNVKIEQRTGRNLPLAILIGLALAGALIASLVIIKALFMIFAGALIGVAAFELASALRSAGRAVPRVPTVIAALAVVPAAFYLGAEGAWLTTLGGILFVALWRLVEQALPSRRTTAPGFWADIGAGTFIQLYVPFLAGFAVLLAGRPGGEWWILAALLIVVSVDIGAYASGLLFGKHPMAPRISPKKTWEGFAGAVIIATIVAILLSIFMLQEPWWFGFVFGAVIVFTATIGDLIESLIKRDLGVKDISTWLPGHGGLLDRLDSILPSSAAAFILYLIFS